MRWLSESDRHFIRSCVQRVYQQRTRSPRLLDYSCRCGCHGGRGVNETHKAGTENCRSFTHQPGGFTNVGGGGKQRPVVSALEELPTPDWVLSGTRDDQRAPDPICRQLIAALYVRCRSPLRWGVCIQRCILWNTLFRWSITSSTVFLFLPSHHIF